MLRLLIVVSRGYYFVCVFLKEEQVETFGCTKHMDVSARDLSVADAPIQDHLAVAFCSDTESWAPFDTARGSREMC